MKKSFKYRIYPSETQKGQLQRFFGVSRMVYNLALETKGEAYKSGVSLGGYDLIKQLTPLRAEFDWIAECPCVVAQQSILDLEKAYINFFKGKGFPKFKNKFSKQSIRFPKILGVDFKNNIIKIPKLKNIKVVYDRTFTGKIKNVNLSKTTTNKYYVSILVDTLSDAPEKKPIDRKTSVGLDFGIKDLAITSEGIVYKNKNFFKSQQKKLRVEQRSLARKQKGSKNRDKQRLKVALLHEKVRNQRTDYLHKISTEIVHKFDTIVVEDLAVANMVKNRHLSKAISDMGWGELRIMLTYKSEWYGKNLIVINRFQPSSKTCSECGVIKEKLKLSERIFHCEACGHSGDRDINAAKNIKLMGLG